MDYKLAVFIGRFQPFHNAHLEVVKHGLSIAENILIVIGSANAAPNIKNPWSYDQRVEMISSCFREADRNRIHFINVRDYFYNDNYWVTDIQAKTSAYIQPGDSVALLGNFKDSSSYYLKYFPQWDFVPVKTNNNFNATDARNLLFTRMDLTPLNSMIPKPILRWISLNYLEPKGFNPDPSTGFQDRCEEFQFIQDYKKQWEKAPYAPTFVTTDCVVVCSGHVLVVKRKFNPGKGLYALPGGFIRQAERIKDAALRELKEETGIRIDKIILDSSIVESKVFDHPDRSLRGRTVTHAFYIKLKDGELPEVKGSDDAEKAQWVALADFNRMEEQLYEDHWHIVNFFVSRG